MAGNPASYVSNSLWQPEARSFFHDPRASRIGDLLTVDVSIADAAQISNTTQRSRTNSDDANLTNFFGLDKVLGHAGADPSSLVKMGSDTSNVGAGSVNRSETVNLTLAAVVSQVLPNGNLLISGHQQVLVNNEMRDLKIGGIVRPEDITNDNTVALSQIAEARVSYGGKGQITDVQQPRLGSQLFDILMPF
jgi:flagellar L-ring protein precursor FlgH